MNEVIGDAIERIAEENSGWHGAFTAKEWYKHWPKGWDKVWHRGDGTDRWYKNWPKNWQQAWNQS
ncbi:hypothetical protein FACS189461_5550 [Spirochaetia bacterium]|nr:hypothetical protein FACS189461_5550 [Spirochaetia bacterium]